MDHQGVGSKSKVWPPHVAALRKAWDDRRLVLCLGAGVSVPYGLPDWRDLVLRLIVEHGPDLSARRPGLDWDAYAYPERTALGRWMMSHFRFDPIRLSRLITAEGDRFLQAVRDEMYFPLAKAPAAKEPNSLTAVGRMIERSERAPGGRHVRSVVTFNFDDLLERELRRLNVGHRSAYEPTTARAAVGEAGPLPVYHVHGYLPRDAAVPAGQQLVFRETSFHEVTTSVQHWGVKRLIRHLQWDVVLFVGVSFEDPNLRRLLDACHEAGADPRHFRVTLDFQLANADRAAAVAEVAAAAERLRAGTGRAASPDRPPLHAAFEEMARQAHDYDRQAMKTLGVRTIWVKDYDDVPDVLEHVFGD